MTRLALLIITLTIALTACSGDRVRVQSNVFATEDASRASQAYQQGAERADAAIDSYHAGQRDGAAQSAAVVSAANDARATAAVEQATAIADERSAQAQLRVAVMTDMRESQREANERVDAANRSATMVLMFALMLLCGGGVVCGLVIVRRSRVMPQPAPQTQLARVIVIPADCLPAMRLKYLASIGIDADKAHELLTSGRLMIEAPRGEQ